ncbi:hypothetical protein [Pedobacter metabolipauper]|uniref:Uncharacterized protein n=1 Tax=Pedobacter metabolipauper TaxID=425513 RepID=A0A4R6T1H4_9SPHI|nr:hypothetical protein [Pedobacter metabolipauper]TDQ11330.1 hypothetical protein ATK78_0448 [Pedobacter metabolipauper]
MKLSASERRKMPKKYKIEECLNRMNIREYKEARRILPGLIGKCINTLNNYRDILEDGNEEIPYGIGITLERFFGLETGKLSNIKIESRHYLEIFKEETHKKRS